MGHSAENADRELGRQRRRQGLGHAFHEVRDLVNSCSIDTRLNRRLGYGPGDGHEGFDVAKVPPAAALHRKVKEPVEVTHYADAEQARRPKRLQREVIRVQHVDTHLPAQMGQADHVGGVGQKFRNHHHELQAAA